MLFYIKKIGLVAMDYKQLQQTNNANLKVEEKGEINLEELGQTQKVTLTNNEQKINFNKLTKMQTYSFGNNEKNIFIEDLGQMRVLESNVCHQQTEAQQIQPKFQDNQETKVQQAKSNQKIVQKTKTQQEATAQVNVKETDKKGKFEKGDKTYSFYQNKQEFYQGGAHLGNIVNTRVNDQYNNTLEEEIFEDDDGNTTKVTLMSLGVIAGAAGLGFYSDSSNKNEASSSQSQQKSTN